MPTTPLPIPDIAAATSTHDDAPQLPLGQILQQAGLLNQVQVDLILRDQTTYGYGLTFGEILVLRGWVKQETCDFFGSRWSAIQSAVQQGTDCRKIGEYLLEAHLLDARQIQAILRDQRMRNLPFGQIAVAKGYLRQETLDFFVQNILTYTKQHQEIAYYIQRAQQDLKNRDFLGAIIELRAALKINPHHAKSHALLAKTYAFQNQNFFVKARWKLARIHLMQAFRLNPKETIIHEFYFREELQGYFSTQGAVTSNRVESNSSFSLTVLSSICRWRWELQH